MTTTTQACIRGCNLLRQHLTTCPHQTCPGCLPRRATRGHLCHPCHRRFELMLTDAPIVYRWLTGNMTADTHPTLDGEPITGTPEQPAPINAAILDIRDLLADQLTEWADEWAELKHLTAPRHHIDADVEFLLRWLYGLEQVEWVGDWWESLAETMRTAHTLAPWRPAMRRIPGVTCPRCNELNLAIWGGETDVSCLSCKAVMTEAEFEIWGQILRMDTA